MPDAVIPTTTGAPSADAVVETPTATPATPSAPAAPAAPTPESIQSGALAALDTAFDGTASAARPEAPLTPAKSAPVPVTKAAKPAPSAAPAENEAESAPVRGPDGKFLPKTAVAADPAAPPTTTPTVEADPVVEKFITDHKLSAGASERFRELNNEVKALKPLVAIKETLEKVGVKDVAQLPAIMDRAQRATEWENFLLEVKTNPEQVGQTFDILGLLNSGDPVKMGKGLELAQAQCDAVAKMLGRSTGTYNPLTDHPDLSAAVESGDITEAYALELAKQRGSGALAVRNVQQTEQQTKQQREQAQALEYGRTELNALGEELKAAAPGLYARLYDDFVQRVAKVRQRAHPTQWAAECREEFADLVRIAQRLTPAQAAPVTNGAQRLPPVGSVPMRPTGRMGNPLPKPTSALEALNQAYELHPNG